MKSKGIVRLLSGMLFIIFTQIGYGQIPVDSGFTNKAEAKNLLVNGLKRGKWVEYFDFNKHDSLVQINDSNKAFYYRLSIYKVGKANGMVRWYYSHNDYISSEVYYSDGEKNGIEKDYYGGAGKKIHREIPYLDGKKNGVEKQFYENGKLYLGISYTNDAINGVEKQFYENGKLYLEIPYTNDRINGVEKKYYDNGDLYWEIPFTNDKIDGVEKEYNKYSHKIVEEIPFMNNAKNGILKEYSDYGVLLRETTFNNNKSVSTRFYNVDSSTTRENATIITFVGGGIVKRGKDSVVDMRDGWPADSSVVLDPVDIATDAMGNIYIG